MNQRVASIVVRSNPKDYLNHLLTVLPERYAANSRASIDDLMPWAEEIQKKFRA